MDILRQNFTIAIVNKATDGGHGKQLEPIVLCECRVLLMLNDLQVSETKKKSQNEQGNENKTQDNPVLNQHSFAKIIPDQGHYRIPVLCRNNLSRV